MTTLTASVWDAPFPRKDCWPCAASRDDLAAGVPPSIRLCDGLMGGGAAPRPGVPRNTRLRARHGAFDSAGVGTGRVNGSKSPASRGRADVRMEYQYWRIAVWSYGMESM